MNLAAATLTADVAPRPRLAPQVAYDLAAPCYGTWRWQEFWRRNEWPLVRNLVERCLTTDPQPRRVIDLGTGPATFLGWLAPLLDSRWARVGVDLSAGMLRLARREADDDVHLVQADIRRVPMADASAGLVLMNRVASHLEHLAPVAEEIGRLLSPGGHAIVSDLAPEHPYVATELPTVDGKIMVTTVKHTVADWHVAADRAGLAVTAVKRITAANATWLPAEGLRSIDRTGRRPIAFVLDLQKRR